MCYGFIVFGLGRIADLRCTPHILISLAGREAVPSLEQFLEMSNRASSTELFHPWMLSVLVSSPMQLQKYCPSPSSFLSSLRGKSSSDMFQESPQPTSLGDSSQGLPLSCHTAESSPYILISLAAREAVPMRI